ncbi:MAG: O-antigen ligase family protein [Patescibacteria group bacterium]
MLETALIILLVVLFAGVAWWKLDWAICITVIFLPAYLLRFAISFVPVTVLELMVLILAAVWGYRTVSERIRTRACPAWLPWRWLLLLFVLAGSLAVFISPDIRQALGLWKAYIIEPVLFFVVFVNTITTRNHVRSVLWALGAGTVLVGYGTLIQYAGLAPIPSPYGAEVPRRATSVFPFPTAVGKLLAPTVALFVGYWVAQAEASVKPLWQFVRRHLFTLGVVLFGLFGLLFSFSRGAVLGVAAAIVFASFFSRWKRWIWVAAAVCLVVLLVVPFTRHQVASVVGGSDTSADVHRVMWRGAVRIIEAHPLLGTGLASFPVVYERYKEASHVEYFPNPDQLILTLWIELGLFGLVVFVALLVKYFRVGLRTVREREADPFVRALTVGLMAALVAIIIHGMVDTPYFKNDLAIQFWVLVGLLVVVSRLPVPVRSISEQPEKNRLGL